MICRLWVPYQTSNTPKFLCLSFDVCVCVSVSYVFFLFSQFFSPLCSFLSVPLFIGFPPLPPPVPISLCLILLFPTYQALCHLFLNFSLHLFIYVLLFIFIPLPPSLSEIFLFHVFKCWQVWNRRVIRPYICLNMALI